MKDSLVNTCEEMRDMPVTQLIVFLLGQRDCFLSVLFLQISNLNVPDCNHTGLTCWQRLAVIQGKIEIYIWTPTYQSRNTITIINILFIYKFGLLLTLQTLTTRTAERSTLR